MLNITVSCLTRYMASDVCVSKDTSAKMCKQTLGGLFKILT